MKRKLIVGAVLLLGAAFAVPFFSADFAQQTLETSLEKTLLRTVRIQGGTRLRLLPRPAIVALDVTIGEDPDFSLEPFAYVTALEVQPSLWALLQGRLEARRLRLSEPSVNLMRSERGWNIQSFVANPLRPPELEVRNGRLNFKQGDSKSAFYLSNALVDLSAPTAQGDVKFFVSAEPARTDRGAQGFGKFATRGQIHLSANGKPRLDVDVELEPSAIHAFNFFFGARGVDFAGKIAGRARIEGPWDEAAVSGSLKFEGLEPQGFLPFAGRANQLELTGRLDLPGQTVSLSTSQSDALRLRMRARDFLQEPKGALLVEVREAAMASLLELGREAGAKIPAGFRAEGQFNGVISYAWPSVEDVPAKGMIWFGGAQVELPDQPALKIPAASAVVEGSRWRMAPAEIRVGESQTAVMQLDWDSRTGGLALDVATQLLNVRSLKSGLGVLLRASTLPLLGMAQGGSWQGNLRFERTEDADEGRWSGRLVVRNAAVELPGFPGQVEVSTASIVFDPRRVAVRRMRAAWESIEVEGDATWYPNSSRADEMQLTVSEAAATSIEKILELGVRPREGLMEKFRQRRPVMPEWLAKRQVTGRILFKSLAFASGAFEPLRLDFVWRGQLFKARISASEFAPRSVVEGVQVMGELEVELWQPDLTYRFEGELQGWPTDRGKLTLDGEFRGKSLGVNWLESLDGEAAMTIPEGARLIVRQGRVSVESEDPQRQAAVVLNPPYWPLRLPPEP